MSEREINKPRYIATAEDRIWRFRRWGYYLAHLLIFTVIIKWIGPNLIIVCRFSSSPEYYAVLSRPYVPMIAAIKAYQRDYGKLPETTYDLPKEYQPANYDEKRIGTILGACTVTFQVEETSVLEYDFTPATEGWIIHAPRCQGPIPVPAVPAAPSPTKPTHITAP